MTSAITYTPWHKWRSSLGYAGLVPFIGCAATLLTTDDLAQGVIVEDGLQYCAAAIASFLGAVHLGGGGKRFRTSPRTLVSESDALIACMDSAVFSSL